MKSRTRMCGNKSTFYSQGRANKHADKYGQRVYECPICFCWHCTSKENWQEEFTDAEVAKRQLATLENKLRAEFNRKITAKNVQIMELQKENRHLKRLAKLNGIAGDGS